MLCATKNLCYQCSDPNIEVHYGTFFINPRILQDDIRGNERQPRCESERSARIQMCRDPYYTLNVTTFDIKTEELLPFGTCFQITTVTIHDEQISARKDNLNA
uniref:DUF4789 domain-containing protein n=1 Tax=Loa loa TaxID=7209 RepID=A0A1I7VMK2_LOALO